MKNLFNSIKLTKPKDNAFDLTHDVKMSGNMGTLYPILNMECVPGDSITLGADSLIRFAPLIAPVMHRLDVTIHYFFVPNRILWENWEKFIVADESAPVFPYFTIDLSQTPNEAQFLDYLGIPPYQSYLGGNYPTQVNALPMAAYQCIYNEYYRDQNLIAEIDYKLKDGSNDINRATFCTLRKRAWEHDYFTSCLPFAQKGAAVDIPLGDVVLKDDWKNYGTPTNQDQNGNPLAGDAEFLAGTGTPFSAGAIPVAYDPQGTLATEPTTINDLRRAFRLQEWLEKNARGGTRYIENILTHFGVKSSDARLQRPEYITGVKSPIVISEVLNMTGENDGLPQGNMAGHAVGVTTGKLGKYNVEEHGYIIGILSVMPKTAYQQGIHKTFLKKDYLDFYWPSFAHIGEQETTYNELYAYTDKNEETFGYLPRYAEYKFLPSRVAGDFRTTLKYWHLGRIFQNRPELNQTFIECNDEDFNERIFAVDDPNVDKLYIQVLNKIMAVRPMPKFGTPTF